MRIDRRRSALLFILGAILLLAAACTEPSTEEFVSEADAICGEAEERFQELDPPQTVDEAANFVQEAETEMNDLISRLQELEVPEESQDDFNTVLTNLEQAVARFDELSAAATDDDLVRFREIYVDLQANSAAAEEAAQNIGLEHCLGDAGP